MGHATDIGTPCSIMKSCFVWRITELSLAGNILYYREILQDGWVPWLQCPQRCGYVLLWLLASLLVNDLFSGGFSGGYKGAVSHTKVVPGVWWVQPFGTYRFVMH